MHRHLLTPHLYHPGYQQRPAARGGAVRREGAEQLLTLHSEQHRRVYDHVQQDGSGANATGPETGY